jgi:hypothetical protein
VAGRRSLAPCQPGPLVKALKSMSPFVTRGARNAVVLAWAAAALLVAMLEFVAAPACAADPWHVERVSDAASNMPSIVVGGDSTNEWTTPASNGRATLMFGCEGKDSTIVVDLHAAVATGHPETISVTYRIDDAKPVHEKWTVAPDAERILSPAWLELLAKLLGAKRFRIEVPSPGAHAASRGSWTADFDLTSNDGFAPLARQVAKDCGVGMPD